MEENKEDFLCDIPIISPDEDSEQSQENFKQFTKAFLETLKLLLIADVVILLFLAIVLYL